MVKGHLFFCPLGKKISDPAPRRRRLIWRVGRDGPHAKKTSCAAESSLVSQVVSARCFLFLPKRQAAFEKKGLRPVAAHALSQGARLQAEKSFFPRACRGKKQIQFYFVLCGGQNSTRFLVCLVGTLFLYPCLGEKKRAVKWPPNKYSIPNAPLSCQPFSVNPHNFSRLPKLWPVILYNFPSCSGPIPVLLYSQKRKTGNKPEGSVTVLRNQRSLDSIEKSFHIQVVLPYEKCMIDMCAE